MRQNATLLAVVALILIARDQAAVTDGEVRLLCSNGIRGAMEKLLPQAERAIGARITVQYGASAVLRRTIEAGEPFDVAIVTPQVVGDLAKVGRIAAGTETEIARVNLGVGIRVRAPRVDISTPEAIKRRVMAAKSLTYAREGASNAAILSMLSRLGIAEEVKAKTVLQAVSGRPAESVAEGENEIVFAPVSEIVMVRGVQVLGLFPKEFQQPIVMTAAVSAKSERTVTAKTLIAFLTSVAAAEVMKASGMEPVSGVRPSDLVHDTSRAGRIVARNSRLFIAMHRQISYPRSSVITGPLGLSTRSNRLGMSDELGWTNKAVVSAYGVNVGINTDDPALLETLCKCLPAASQTKKSDKVDLQYSMYSRPSQPDGRPVQPFYVGHSSTGLIVETFDKAKACEAFESAVQLGVAAASTEWVFVRAGVVGWNGKAIVIPAPSQHGTSRLVEALVRAGATYYSDEFAVIASDGAVHPFRIPLSFREPGGRRRVNLLGPPAEAPPPPLRIRTIVVTRHEPGAEWRPRRGTPGEALIVLLSNSVRARLAPGDSMKVLARALVDAVMLEGPRGDADWVAPRLLEASR